MTTKFNLTSWEAAVLDQALSQYLEANLCTFSRQDQNNLLALRADLRLIRHNNTTQHSPELLRAAKAQWKAEGKIRD